MSDNTQNSSFDLGTIVDTAKQVILDPVGFYKNMPTSGGYAQPIIFVVVMAVAAAIVGAILSLVGLGSYGAVGTAGILAIIVLPIFAIVLSFIGAAVVYFIWTLMGSSKNFETAYRCTAYAWAIAPIVMLISIVPYLSSLIQPIWLALLMYLASIHVHNLKENTAKIVFAVLAIIAIIVNVQSERKARMVEERLARVLGEDGDLSPEDAGRAVGEFLKGIKEAAEEAEKNKND